MSKAEFHEHFSGALTSLSGVTGFVAPAGTGQGMAGVFLDSLRGTKDNASDYYSAAFHFLETCPSISDE